MAWIDFLKDIKDQFSEKTALVDQEKNRNLTYQQLVEEVDRLAWFLKEHNVEQGDRVTYLRTNSLEHITLFLACAKIGAIFIPLNFRLSCGELSEITHRVTPKLRVGMGQDELKTKDYPYCDLSEINLNDYEQPFVTVETSEEDPLLMLFTSGTTGTPKGVLFSGKMLRTNQQATCENWGLVSEDKTLVETPFFHTGGYNVLCLPLMSIGGTSVIAEKFDLDNVYETIEKEKLTVYFAVPTMFQMISEDSRFKDTSFSSLRFFISGGAHCPKELISTYQKKNLMFKQGFGLTEVGPNCFLLDESDAIRKLGSIGKPMPHSKVRLIDNHGGDVAPGEVGELLIGGDHVCAGYFNEKKRFEEATKDGLFKTGDLAKKDEDGFYFIVGRKKDMYISGGENVYPAEVEKKIRALETVHEVAVVAVEDEKWGEVGFAFLRADREFDVIQLKELLNDQLSRYKHPHYIENIKEFPLLSSGKIDRKALQAKAAASVSTPSTSR